MAIAGFKGIPRTFGGTQPPNPVGSIRSVYDAAASTQAQDYDNIMAGYDALQAKASQRSGQNALSPIATRSLPSYNYNRTPELSSTISGLQNFAQTGGIDNVGDIRERALSPIRAAYGNARRNVDRQKVLQGGYSPNYGALTAKLAREQSDALSNASINVNAEIAKLLSGNKLSALGTLSSATGSENALSNQIGQNNVNAERAALLDDTADQRNVRNINSENIRNNDNTELQTLQGRQSLYGTTPALTNTFANQVLQNNQQHMNAVATANQIKNARSGVGLNLVSQARGLG